MQEILETTGDQVEQSTQEFEIPCTNETTESIEETDKNVYLDTMHMQNSINKRVPRHENDSCSDDTSEANTMTQSQILQSQENLSSEDEQNIAIRIHNEI